MPEDPSDAIDDLEAALAARDGSAFLKTAEGLHYADLATAYEDLDRDHDRAMPGQIRVTRTGPLAARRSQRTRPTNPVAPATSTVFESLLFNMNRV